MLSGLLVPLAVLAAATGVVAGPLLDARQGVSLLSASQIASYKPYTYFASAAYCSPDKTLTWTCGTNCDHNSGFKPIASGGDGAVTQYWYVGYDPTLASIIVAFQGTDVEKLIPVITDGNFVLAPLDPTLFPNVSPVVATHAGFGLAHKLSALDVLAAVKKGISQFSAKKVTVVGHSLGGAISIISSSFLAIHLPGTTIKTVTYSAPRVGDVPFVNFANARSDMMRINNKKDPIPTLPLRTMGFAGTEGEIHINDTNKWISCPGQDNPSPQCTVASVPVFLLGDVGDHSGPFDGVTIGC